MSSEITCPVCHFEHIPRDRDTCPQCDSDLICFKLLDALTDQPQVSLSVSTNGLQPDLSAKTGNQTVEQDKLRPDADKVHQRKLPWILITQGGIVLLAVACFFGYAGHRFFAVESTVQIIDIDMARMAKALNKNTEVILTALDAGAGQMNHLEERIEELVEMTKEHEIRLTEIVSEKEKASKFSAEKTEVLKIQDGMEKEKPCFAVYHAKDSDTLWDIACDLYGSGLFYPILLEHNPDLQVYNISSRDTIRYLCDKTLAAGVYKAITGKKQNRRYWRYTVRPGDTRRAIMKRYCLNRKDCLVEDILLEPGVKIGVFLE